jgi:hypothetical protein
MINRKDLAAFVLGTACLVGGSTAAGPLDPEANTDGFSPAAEIDEANEARRRDLIARQLDLNLQMNWFSGYGPQCLDPFEPWQSVSGDIWGYPRPRPIEQPIGHESAQTGPNRWIYRPLYAEPTGSATPGRGKPAASNEVGPRLPGPSEANVVLPTVRPKKKPVLGPREF